MRQGRRSGRRTTLPLLYIHGDGIRGQRRISATHAIFFFSETTSCCHEGEGEEEAEAEQAVHRAAGEPFLQVSAEEPLLVQKQARASRRPAAGLQLRAVHLQAAAGGGGEEEAGDDG
jgi:hypothetical protein